MGQVSEVSQYVSEVRENGGLSSINDIFDVLLNESETDVLF